jgi:hypothetical protein
LRGFVGPILFGLALLLAASGRAYAQEEWESNPASERASSSDWGGVGLMQTRTARFAKDGQFTIGAIFSDPYDRYPLTWQILPWLEATFRYTTDRQRGDQGLDRSADVKIRLFEETRQKPEIALGFQDLGGTGVFDGEYIVASKRINDFDFSLGVAWGYSVGGDGLLKNPLRFLSSRFDQRDDSGGTGGSPGIGAYFAGPDIDLFGGVEYHTPIEGLSLKAEYDPNDYKLERGGPLKRVLPINLGLSYRPWDWLEFGLAYERGNTLMARISLRADLDADEWVPKVADPPPPPMGVRPRSGVPQGAAAGQPQAAAAQAADRAAVAAAPVDLDLLRAEMLDQGLTYEGIEVVASTATVRLSAGDQSGIDAKLKALAPVIVAQVPEAVTDFKFSVRGGDGPRREIGFGREELTRTWLVDALFDRLRLLGLQVEAVDHSNGHAVLRVGAEAPKGELDYLVAARAVRDLAPLPAHTVTVLAQREGHDASSLVLKVADGSHVFTPRLATAEAQAPKGDGPTPLSQAQAKAIAQRIFGDLPPHGLTGEALRLTRQRAVLTVTPATFPEVARNVGRAARVAATHLPPSVETIVVIIRTGGLDIASVTLLRRHLEDLALGAGSPEEIMHSSSIERPQPELQEGAIAVANDDVYPRFNWGFGPDIRPSIGAPEDPFLFQVWARLSGQLELMQGLTLRGTAGKDIYNNFDKITRGTKGTLQPVRSNIKEYLQQGEDALVQAQADYVFTPAPDWYARAAVGYLEMMYGGVSGEVLYRPQNARWAIGLELSHVFQRDFNQLLGFQSFDTTTGHLGLYYKLPYYGLEATVQAGRYLARDWGATFQLARRFNNGIRVGAFFTLTTASAEEFGEGSFDKGFFFSVPMSVFLPFASRDRLGTLFRPLTSDGGQMVNVGPKLYDLTEEGQLDGIARDWRRLMD